MPRIFTQAELALLKTLDANLFNRLAEALRAHVAAWEAKRPDEGIIERMEGLSAEEAVPLLDAAFARGTAFMRAAEAVASIRAEVAVAIHGSQPWD